MVFIMALVIIPLGNLILKSGCFGVTGSCCWAIPERSWEGEALCRGPANRLYGSRGWSCSRGKDGSGSSGVRPDWLWSRDHQHVLQIVHGGSQPPDKMDHWRWEAAVDPLKRTPMIALLVSLLSLPPPVIDDAKHEIEKACAFVWKSLGEDDDNCLQQQTWEAVVIVLFGSSIEEIYVVCTIPTALFH